MVNGCNIPSRGYPYSFVRFHVPARNRKRGAASRHSEATQPNLQDAPAGHTVGKTALRGLWMTARENLIENAALQVIGDDLPARVHAYSFARVKYLPWRHWLAAAKKAFNQGVW